MGAVRARRDDPDFILTDKIISAGIKVHNALGPGLLERAYEACLEYELDAMGLGVERQKKIPIQYQSIMIDGVFCADLIINNEVLVELKAVDKLLPIHEAQLMTYLKLTGLHIGLLMNFNVPLLKNGIKRLAVGFRKNSVSSSSSVVK